MILCNKCGAEIGIVREPVRTGGLCGDCYEKVLHNKIEEYETVMVKYLELVRELQEAEVDFSRAQKRFADAIHNKKDAEACFVSYGSNIRDGIR